MRTLETGKTYTSGTVIYKIVQESHSLPGCFLAVRWVGTRKVWTKAETLIENTDNNPKTLCKNPEDC